MRLDRLTATGISIPTARHAALPAECRFKHPQAKWMDQPRLLGHRNELTWREESPLRMLPAHQGFGADERAVTHVQPGLVMQEQLMVFDVLPQLSEQRQTVRPVLVLGMAVHRRAYSQALGLVHGDVRAAQHRICILTVLRCNGDTYARVYLDRLAVPHERCQEDPYKILGHLRGLRGVDPREQNREFVVAKVSDQVGRQHGAL
jgi:hypothetical protein